MTTKTETLAWDGLTLEISMERNAVLSRITGEEYTSLKATDLAHAKSLFLTMFLPFPSFNPQGEPWILLM